MKKMQAIRTYREREAGSEFTKRNLKNSSVEMEEEEVNNEGEFYESSSSTQNQEDDIN